MNEPPNDPTDGRGGVSEAVAALRQTSFLRVMLLLAATGIVLVIIRLGAPILNPIFFALVLSLLFSPIYSWLGRRGLPSPVALVIMLIVIGALFTGLFVILGASISRFSERVGYYTSQLNSQVVSLDALLERLGLSNADLRDVVKPNALADALGVVLSGITGFLGDLFLILMIMLFLLGEGPAMMNRLRTSVAKDNPQVQRLTTVGRSVVRQFGLRAIVNLVTGAGGDTRGDFGPRRVRCDQSASGHRRGDSHQRAGRECALTAYDGPGAQHLADDRVLVFHRLGVAARGTGCVPGAAHHPLCCRDARYLRRDPLAG